MVFKLNYQYNVMSIVNNLELHPAKLGSSKVAHQLRIEPNRALAGEKQRGPVSITFAEKQ